MKRFCVILFASLLFISCSNDDSSSGSSNPIDDGFDRSAMLSNWADNIIIPSLINFDNLSSALQNKTLAFTENPSVETLSALRASYKEAYLGFQKVSLYQIGPAETLNYRSFLNTYPVDKPGVENSIETGNFDLENIGAKDQQGFPAMDLMLNGLRDSDMETVDYFSQNAEARNYLNALAGRMRGLTSAVLNQWENSYRDDFVANTSSSSTGSIDKFTNDYIFYYEKLIRTAKIGIPAGAFTGSPQPQNVESYYAPSFSKELYTTALQTAEDFFKGQHLNDNQSGLSFEQYLDKLDSQKDGDPLSTLIDNQFQAIDQANEGLNSNLVQQIETDPNQMLSAYDKMQKNVVLLKVDMLQALSISVDYGDTDGD